MVTPVPLAQVRPAGDLLRRAELNFRRLHDAEFQFDAMMTAFTAKDAPGEWVGRCLLALTEYAQLLGREAPQMAEIVARLPDALNARGYLGEIMPSGTVDENQIGGHNALLRGLCENYRWRRDERLRTMIRSIIENLMLPTLPMWAVYPDQPDLSLRDNQLVGLTMHRSSGVWRGLSTDIGVGFFTLDGLTQAYTVVPSPGLRDLIETMIARYVRFDPVQHSAQTHATLTTLRGIMRWWREVDPRPEYLELVRARHARYRDLAETEHHGNYNWFGRPDWTEPCAIVDAYLLVVQLWSATGDTAYLEEAHRIFFNALAHAQRPNGGYGCDLCTGARDLLWVVPHEFFEAPWCCSMRGAEGLARAAQFGWFTGVDELVLPFYLGGTAQVDFPDGQVEITQHSEYPREGVVRLEVKASTLAKPKTLRFFAPTWSPPQSFRFQLNQTPVVTQVEGSFASVTLELRAGDVLRVAFELDIAAVPLQNPGRQPGYHRFAHGPLLLGHAGAEPVAMPSGTVFTPMGAGRYRCAATGRTLAPLPTLIDVSEVSAKAARTQIVFAD
ncbi:MAG: glycoside hydrolase family 127 protein [Opitutaceae bacterium]|nr:glycoside hydrolase family 127 protein [Opitutaceae bacterium]